MRLFVTKANTKSVNLTEVIQNPPSPHRDDQGKYYSMGLPETVLRFIEQRIDKSANTLETGCGLSTVMFALSGSHHICINPSLPEIERIKEYCLENHIPAQRITFCQDISENVLPRLECDMLDLVLIDGRHGFPAPFIDFYYLADKLKIDGLMVIDDTWLWTGDVLKQYLLAESEWELVADFFPRTSVFRKLADGSQTKEWTEQAFVVEHSRFKLREKPPSYFVTAGRYLKRGEYLLLAKKIYGKLRVSKNSPAVL
jgi:hypothetical protein